MADAIEYDHLLIRDGAVLLRIQRGEGDEYALETAELFDVRTGVKLREIHPALQRSELLRAYAVPEQSAAVIIKSGAATGAESRGDISKVVNILDLKQRRLDNVVADSILYQIRLIRNLLDEFLQVAESAQKEHRFWMSQQVLALVAKFSGREMSELEELISWMRSHSGK